MPTNNPNTLQLKILDTEFTVKAETEAQKKHLIRIQDYVNDELTKLKEKNQFINHIRIAILGCMNITEELFDLQDRVSQIDDERKMESEKYGALEEQVESLNQQLKEEKEESEETVSELVKQLEDLKQKQELLDKQINEKNELLNQYREKLTQSKNENDANRKSIIDLQNQLFENQIELVKLSKESKISEPEIEKMKEEDEMEDQELTDIIKALQEQAK